MPNLENVATLTRISGYATVERDGENFITLQNGVFFVNDTIKSQKAAVEITFADGSISILGPNSVVKIENSSSDAENPSFVLKLSQGSMRAIGLVMADGTTQAFEVATPHAHLKISGTDSGITINADGSEKIVAFALEQGHNLIVTTPTENVAINTENHGLSVSSGSTSIISQAYTAQETSDIINKITAGIFYNEDKTKLVAALDNKQKEEEQQKEEQEVIQDEGQEEITADAGSENQSPFNSTLLSANIVSDLSSEALTALVLSLESSGFDTNINAQSMSHLFGHDANLVAIAASDDYSPSTIPSVSIGGQASYNPYADTISSGIHLIKQTNINITQDLSNNVTISGDVQTITNGIVQAGSSTISAGSLSNGRIVGDANTMNGGALVAGDDTISTSSKTGGNSIYGDVYEALGGNISFGDDYIFITGEVSNTYIAGDANKLNAATVSISDVGNDTIAVGRLGLNGKIYGDYADILNAPAPPAAQPAGGNDIIFVAEMVDNAAVYGGAGDDRLGVGKLYGGTIEGGEGNDILLVEEAYGGTIAGGEGTNTYYVDYIDSNKELTVIADGTSDLIYLQNGISKDATLKIEGTSGELRLAYVSNGTSYHYNLTDGTIEITDAGSLKLNSIKGGTLTGADNDTANDFTLFSNMTGGTINTYGGNDSITITTANANPKFMTGGSINTGEGDDSVSISNMANADEKNIDLGTGADTFSTNLYSTTQNAKVDLGNDNDKDKVYLSGEGTITLENFDKNTDEIHTKTGNQTNYTAYTDASALQDAIDNDTSININGITIYFT